MQYCSGNLFPFHLKFHLKKKKRTYQEQQNGSSKQRVGASNFHCGFRQSTENWVICPTPATAPAAWVAPLIPQWAIIPLLFPLLGWEGEQFTLACTSSTWDPNFDNRRRSKVMFSLTSLLSPPLSSLENQNFLPSSQESRLRYSVFHCF